MKKVRVTLVSIGFMMLFLTSGNPAREAPRRKLPPKYRMPTPEVMTGIRTHTRDLAFYAPGDSFVVAVYDFEDETDSTGWYGVDVSKE
jgi:hypothetical protein